MSSLKMDVFSSFFSRVLAAGFREAISPQNLQVPRSSFLAIQAMHTMVIASGPVVFCRVAIFWFLLGKAMKGMEGWKSLKNAWRNSRNQTSKIPFKRCLTLFGSQNQRDVVLGKRIIRVRSFDSRNMGRPLTLTYTSWHLYDLVYLFLMVINCSGSPYLFLKVGTQVPMDPTFSQPFIDLGLTQRSN